MPFLLSGDYSLAALDADRDPLRDAYRALSDAEVDAATTQAQINWDASTDAALQGYEVRGCAGDRYDADDGIFIATIPAGGTREALTAFALNALGLTAGFKV
jgi:hypothetical protein